MAEVVSWRGLPAGADGSASLELARELAADSRIHALSVTDNAGGHAMLGPVPVAELLRAAGAEVVVHVACRDRSRLALQSLGWELAGRGLRNVLAVSGDLPVEGFGGTSRPAFDLDSVGLVDLYRRLDAGLVVGVAVDPFKRLESELVPQLLKLALKVRVGAAFVITQVGYDARALDELLRILADGPTVPAVANVYVLSRGVARAFHAGRVPGVRLTDELRAVVERQAAGPDRGRAFFLELAAKQVAVARGLGYRGVYLAGHRSAAEVDRILGLAVTFAPDWRQLAADVTFAPPGAFRLFETDPGTGLATGVPSAAAIRSTSPDARRRARGRVVPAYRLSRLVHALAFAPGSTGFAVGARLYRTVERTRLARPLHVLEQAVKLPLYDCRDCGDCSLPEVAYLCPESRCPKHQRNGPCGGSRDGRCEQGDRRCVWVLAYDRLKPYGEERRMLDRSPVVPDAALARTSAWANTFLERDHTSRPPAAAPPAATSREGPR